VAIPATVQESGQVRLASLGAAAQQVAQVAAVWGRAVTEGQLQATVGLEGRQLDRAAGRVGAAGILHELSSPPRVTEGFKHALLQEVAYQSLLPRMRQQVHQRISQVLEAQFPDAIEAQPELLAHHYTEAGLTVQALAKWQQAGDRDVKRSANVEAVQHFR